MERTGCPGRDVLSDQPWEVGAASGGRADVIHCQDLDGGVNDSLGTPRAAASEQRSQSDQIAPSAVADGQLLPICPGEKDADDASADERDPWWRARAKDEIAGRDVCRLDYALEHFLPDRAPSVLDVLDQSTVRITLCGAIGL